MKLVKDFLCDSCMSAGSIRGIEFKGIGKYEKIQVCRSCVIRAYEVIREDEKKDMAADMRTK
jgi:hypothetical protein